MIQPWVFSIEWENHCRNCTHNSSDYWCDKYNCCPCQALTLCNADGFHFEENKNATEEKFEACRLDIIKYDEDLKICMQELANILGIEYNPNLK